MGMLAILSENPNGERSITVTTSGGKCAAARNKHEHNLCWAQGSKTFAGTP
jgi:hypothetical protein